MDLLKLAHKINLIARHVFPPLEFLLIPPQFQFIHKHNSIWQVSPCPIEFPFTHIYKRPLLPFFSLFELNLLSYWFVHLVPFRRVRLIVLIIHS